MIYSNFITAKNGSLIPVFKSGRTLESKYNPEKEADTLLSSQIKNFNFYLITGIGSGILYKKILEHNPEAKIIGIENSREDIDFLKEQEPISENINNLNIIITTKEDLCNQLIENYIPAKYGDLKLIELPNWINEVQNDYAAIKDEIKKAINLISADFSVQSHFGKIWTKNILNNIKQLSKNENIHDIKINNNKTAIIVAAGPTLDQKIQYLKDNISSFYIIATDTAYSTLMKNDISSNIVVSLDGQSVSYNHFMHNLCNQKTIFAFDLCSNFTASKHVNDSKLDLIYFISGHPLAECFNSFINNKLIKLNSGAGTVTIAALDLAVKLGFQNIQILGADFSYSNGKSYTKGTYLDSLYSKDSNKLTSTEQKYDKLLFRTELLRDKNKMYTKVLDSYKSTLIDYLNNYKLNFQIKNDIYYIQNSQNPDYTIDSIKKFDFDDFIQYYKNLNIKYKEICNLPYIAWLRKNNRKEVNYEDLQKLAQSFIVSYNREI